MNHGMRGKRVLMTRAFAAIGVALLLLYPGTRARAGSQDRPAGKVSNNGAPGITLDEISQEKAGIVTEALRPVMHRQEVEAYGAVLQADDLIAVRKDYASAKAAADKSAAALDASRREYERLKALDGNVSEKALEAAKAVWKADGADASEASVLLKTVEDSAGLRWGGVLSGWVFGDTPEFRRLMALRDVLIRVTLPPERNIGAAPPVVTVRSPDGTTVQAGFINRISGTDPRIQGLSFICLAPSASMRLLAGMNVTVLLPSGPATRGYVIPLSAVIWHQGSAWVYIRKGEERFIRREVPVSSPSGKGYFVTEGFSPGDRIVIRGAQVLLSAEFLPKTTGGEED